MGGGGGGKKGYHSQRICASRRDLKVDEAKKCQTLKGNMFQVKEPRKETNL